MCSLDHHEHLRNRSSCPQEESETNGSGCQKSSRLPVSSRVGGGRRGREERKKGKKKMKKREVRGGGEKGGGFFFLSFSLFFEWNPAAGPDGERRRAQGAPVSAAPEEDVMRLHG